MSWAARVATLGSGDVYPNATLALDFLRGFYKSGGRFGSGFASLPGLTVTRATPSVAYGTTSGGVLVPFAANVARITDQGLLVEEARTNLLLQNQALSNASWNNNNGIASVVEGALGPDNTLTASTVTESTANVDHSLGQKTVTIVSGTTYTMTAYVSAGTSAFAFLRLGSVGSANNFILAIYNVSTGVVGQTATGATSGTITAASITPISGGYYRITLTGSISVTDGAPSVGLTNAINGFSPSTFGSLIYTGTSRTIIATLPQLEAGAFATSPIPTTSASVTRPADVLQLGGLNAGGAWTLYAEALTNASSSAIQHLAVLAADSSNRVGIDRTATPNMELFATSASVFVYDKTVASSGAIIAKTAIGFDGTTYRSAVGGSSLASAAGAAPAGTLSTLYLGQNNSNAQPLNGYLRRLLLYPTGYSGAQLQALTT